MNSMFPIVFPIFGKIPAIIEGAWIGFEISDRAEPPCPTLLNEDHSLLVAPVLAAGERRDGLREYLPAGMAKGVDRGVYDRLRGEGLVTFVPELDLPDGFQLFFRGKITYHGPFTVGHETGALWFNLAGGQFVQRGGNEYNYSR